MPACAYFPVPQKGVKTETFSPQNDHTTELNVNFLLTATVIGLKPTGGARWFVVHSEYGFSYK